jgi:predicted ATP-grasp superfamily ATP-dependent carboligase
VESVLVLDANQRSALAVTRSLGRRGVRVIAADDTRRSLAGQSRFAAGTFTYPPPRTDAGGFLDALAAACRRLRVDVLYPMSDVTMRLVLEHEHRLSPVVVPFGPFEAYEQLSDKWRFFELCRSLGLPMPVTHFVQHAADLDRVRTELRFPLVIKPCRSQLFDAGRWRHVTVRYADSFAELRSIAASVDYFGAHPFLLQEYIGGEHQGIFALSDRGAPDAYFANRRLRDVPPAGGIVVLVESIPMNPKTREIARALLSHVGWHGVAMVECKVRHGVPYILEANARFWASTQLAVDCGVDYPWLLFQLATGRPVDRPVRYHEHRRLRDLLGDIEHYYMTKAGLALNRYESPAERRRALAGFWRPVDRRTYYEKNRWDDLGPFGLEVARALRAVRPLRALRHLVSGIRRE